MAEMIDSQQEFSSKAWSYHRQPNGKDEWLTPPELIRSIGEFDLDPCAPVKRPWDTAKFHFTEEENGLLKEWFGRVWCNPPYTYAERWLGRCADYGNAIALVFARTETKMFFKHVFERADSIIFIKGRIKFYHVDGTKPEFTSGAGSCLIAYGLNNADILRKAVAEGRIIGAYIDLKKSLL